ncbi:SRPBCC family protein [Streptomyces uncialis]|uniref:Polyketide cyclase n=1 Tax=Streptomyces uncialis TaxID=1048205 RepID=A0A1Q4UXK1_9ACTN|nr:SRPBCC family protein [Streptomyces uncialis]MCX4662280.1 SRPBCC family protein [Streptomyces uncialis]OKH90298.1 polyketide cyclase [Streptomyces uncialis]WTE09529.1 SRPBCC family protein [Streptomyces uncialis]
MTHSLSPVGLDFASTAPVRLVFAREIPAAPDAVFQALARQVEDWPLWFGAVTEARSADGGKRRVVRLRGGGRFEETVIAVDAPAQYAYRVDRTNVPGARGLLEEWLLTPTPDGTRVQWTFAADGTAVFRFALRRARSGLGSSFREAMESLAERLEPTES